MPISKTIMSVLFSFVMASSFLVLTGFVGYTFAAKKVADDNTVTNTIVQPHTKENTDPLNSQSAYVGDSSVNTPNTDITFAKDLKKFSKCLTSVAADGDLSLIEVTDCYHQVF
jgi:hypothetical protein